MRKSHRSHRSLKALYRSTLPAPRYHRSLCANPSHRSNPIAPTVATLPDVRPTLDPRALPVMQLCQPYHCHRWNHAKTR
ncbi:hypothetical protein [Microcoleus vaginatus]|uniref:hypothetical protein n=1 Tax=Microcoleus vaginatus TaxID=119532 RepID=UPI0032A55CF5